MTEMTVTASGHDFTPLHQGMQEYVDREILAGISSAVLIGQDLVDVHCAGMADRENNIPMNTEALFRIYSNTKLMTSLAVLQLMEAGKFDLDDPIAAYIQQFSALDVLKPGATTLDDTEPANGPVTIRQLMTHTSGFSYAFVDPRHPLSRAYKERKVGNPDTDLAGMMDVLAELPLIAQPGTAWNYSHSTDVLARLIEIISGRRFGDHLQDTIFDPLGMADTGFVVPEEKRGRLAAYYIGADVLDPMKGGLTRSDTPPFAAGGFEEIPYQSGGGGLVSTLPDTVALLRSLIDGGPDLFSSEIRHMIRQNQLPDGLNINFVGVGEIRGHGYGLASGICVTPSPSSNPKMAGEIYWGGVAGTQWWISPATNSAGLLMTQRQMSFTHPFAADLKNRVYQVIAG